MIANCRRLLGLAIRECNDHVGDYCTGVFFSSMAVVGTALGFVFGAMSLNIFTDFYAFTPDE